MLFNMLHLIVGQKRSYNYYQLFLLSHTAEETLGVLYRCLLQPGHCMPSLKEARKQGKISTSSDDSPQVGTSWPDETHFLDRSIHLLGHHRNRAPSNTSCTLSPSGGETLASFTFLLGLFCNKFDHL